MPLTDATLKKTETEFSNVVSIVSSNIPLKVGSVNIYADNYLK